MMWNYSILVTVGMRIGTYSELGGAGLCDVHLRNRYAQNFKKDFKLHVKRINMKSSLLYHVRFSHYFTELQQARVTEINKKNI